MDICKMIKVSVVVPVYNAEQFIEKTLYSICNQTYKNLEILVINDGSTDGSGEIINKFAMLDSRISVFNQVNQGITRTRNLGLQRASGECICFVDSDDWVSDNFIMVLVSAFDKEGVDIAFSNHAIVENNIPVFRDDYQGNVYVNPDEKNGLLCNIYFPAVHGKIYRTEFLERFCIKFLEEDTYGGFAEDILFNFYAVNFCKKIVFVGDEYYFYNRDNTNSICASPAMQGKNNNDRLKVISKIFASANKLDYRNEISSTLEKITTQHIMWGGKDMANKFIKLPWVELTSGEREKLYTVSYKVLKKNWFKRLFKF